MGGQNEYSLLSHMHQSSREREGWGPFPKGKSADQLSCNPKPWHPAASALSATTQLPSWRKKNKTKTQSQQTNKGFIFPHQIFHILSSCCFYQDYHHKAGTWDVDDQERGNQQQTGPLSLMYWLESGTFELNSVFLTHFLQDCRLQVI